MPERTPTTAPTDDVSIRIERLARGAPETLLTKITAMLHRAYRGQVELGLRPLAGRQDPATTRRRCDTGEAYIAYLAEDAGPAGMILLQEVEDAAFPDWFLRPEVGHFSLFAVDPPLQRHGLGHRLLERIERRTRDLGLRELALSMAEPDVALHAYYLRRGYRFVQHWRWPYTNYRSVIMSRDLSAS